MIKNVLCVCKGNSDRSPMMAAVLQMYLENTVLLNDKVHCESAGILEIASKGGKASSFMVKAARRIGIDLSRHSKHWIDSLCLSRYDLFVCVDEDVAAYVLNLGVDIEKICNAQVSNPWPSQFQEDHDNTAGKIMERMFHVVTRYFSE